MHRIVGINVAKYRRSEYLKKINDNVILMLIYSSYCTGEFFAAKMQYTGSIIFVIGFCIENSCNFLHSIYDNGLKLSKEQYCTI